MEELFINLSWNKKLEVLRIMKGWSQREAAEACGTNQKGYWNWENGLRTPNNDSKKNIAKAFGIHVNEIFAGGNINGNTIINS